MPSLSADYAEQNDQRPVGVASRHSKNYTDIDLHISYFRARYTTLLHKGGGGITSAGDFS